LALYVGDMPGADVKHVVDQAFLRGELAERCLVSEHSHIDQVYFHFHQLIQILYSFAQAYPPKKSKSQPTVAYFLFTALSADLSYKNVEYYLAFQPILLYNIFRNNASPFCNFPWFFMDFSRYGLRIVLKIFYMEAFP
ncbi:MAG: hypothetical protein IJF67_16505, partial [Clostridia bacterium]|nr:hypothetical protein [Clostridia bacterium]